MSTAKDQLRKLLDEQPDDSSYEELVRELAFSVMYVRVSKTLTRIVSFPTRKWDTGSAHGGTEMDR